MTPYAWLAVALTVALPAYTAFRYAHFAWHPDWLGDEVGLQLLLLYAAQFPVTLLGGVFAGVSYIEGPGWRRVRLRDRRRDLRRPVRLAKVVWESDLAPIVGWAIALQVVVLMFVGSQPALALARIDAVTTDAVNLTVLAAYAGLLAIAAGIVFLESTGGIHAPHHPMDLGWTDLAWLGAIYFAMRAWSVAYAYTPTFATRRKGYFDRPWINRAARLWKAEPSSTD